jgi:MFS transporter, ACS family, solute carrier family 17 (sodium-dependent inorganic phosphate cotransporter), other
VGILTPDRTLTQWRMVFFISCGFLVITNMVYIIFATGKTQAWNNPEQPNKSLENGTTENQNNVEKSKEETN